MGDRANITVLFFFLRKKLEGGERMNKKALMLTASLLAVAMLVTPVMSVSPKKIPVTIDRSDPWYIPPPPTKVWISGDVKHGRGFTGGWAHFNITGIGMDDLNGSMSCVGNYNVNLENGHGAVHIKMVITFPGGTFEGQHNQRGIFNMMGPGGAFPALIDGTTHAVFHGTGDYLGWTYVVTSETGQPREAYMLIP